MKWLRRTLVLVLTVWLVLVLLLRHWTAQPPPLPTEAASVLQQPIVERDGKRWVGKSWLGQREGLPVLYLTGTPFEMGYANGRLTQDRIQALETETLAMVHQYVPNEWAIKLLKNYIIFRNRNLRHFVAPRFQLELLGMTHGCPDAHPELGAYFNRVLNYHAAHDISYMLIDNPLVTGTACTSFGAWRDGRLVSGRNFDWEADPIFDRDRVLILCEPADGIPFISLAWAGMAGVVSGMNRAGVSVALNGAPSELPHEIGTPAAMVAREILERAHNLAVATKILQDARVFVSTIWLIGSRTDGKFIVIEKTPQTTHVREPVTNQIICANHFMVDNPPRNAEFMTGSTSVSRYTRASELLTGDVTVARAVEIMRDRNLPGGVFAGNGHRASLNADIATHGVALDLTAGTFYAGTTPHLLGKFVAFDVNDFSRELPGISADESIAFADFDKSRKLLATGRKELQAGNAAQALQSATAAAALNRGFYEIAALQGRALLALGKTNEARRAFNEALAGKPAFAKEVEALQHAVR